MINEIISEQADIETSAENYTSRFTGKVGEYFLELQKKITLDLLSNENVKTILDVGGGHAQLAVPLAKTGYQITITGSDSSCRNRLDKLLSKDEFKFEECDFLSLPFAENSFDAVICFRLITHEKNWKILIKELCRVSKNVIIIDYPDIRSFNIFSRILFNLKKQVEKNTRTFRSFSRKELKSEFIKSDFKYFIFKPQYFLPMVIYRILKSIEFLKISESIFKLTGLQYLFGTPVILKIKKDL